jgi:hypothetical protein
MPATAPRDGQDVTPLERSNAARLVVNTLAQAVAAAGRALTLAPSLAGAEAGLERTAFARRQVLDVQGQR